MSGDCQNCAALHAQLMRVVAGVQATLAFIDDQLDEPTMPAKQPRTGSYKGPDLISSVQAMLGSALNQY